ncbi:MAG: GGDEF domain-containing protein [Methylibium sp.]|uniref:GGDEF domain-containing protein n=1 Tax=Methylibium sp. TaxID=2067992 RepID=UPI0017FF3A99|nr:GGDEF domain-containing protein [Methylibium sp.]MBA3599232.1 GGDEF domain-containing protein [Methylibium sp.]
MINPMSTQLLMPLAPHGDLLNLFDVLDPVAPQLRELAVAESEPGAVICDGLRVRLTSVGQPAELPSTLAISLLRLDETTLMCSVSDVTLVVQQEQQRLVSQLRDATRIDSLTLMPNRAVVIERIDGALHKARTDPQYEFAVLFINGDRFNRINVTLGQSAGDELLRLMAARMNGTVRMRDAVGRATDPEQTAARHARSS